MDIVARDGQIANRGVSEPFIDQISGYAFYMLDTAGCVSSWNEGADRLTGYSADEAIGRHFSEMYEFEVSSPDPTQFALDAASRTGFFREDGWMMRKDCKRFWSNILVSTLRSKSGELQGYATLVQDLSTGKTDEARYRVLFEHSYDAIFLTRVIDGIILAANPAACELFGYSEQELKSMRREDLLDPTDSRFTDAWARRAIAGIAAAELRFLAKSGDRLDTRTSSWLFDGEQGERLGCTIVHDITERKKVEEALRRSEEHFRLLYENAPLGILHTDAEGRITSANRKIAEITGYSQEELVGLNYVEFTLAENLPLASELWRKFFSGKEDVTSLERPLRCKDGGSIWVRLTAKLMRDETGTSQWAIVIFEDITERKRAEVALRDSEEKFRATIEYAPVGIGEFTPDGRCVDANPKFLEIAGYTKEELSHLLPADVTHPSDLENELAKIHRLETGETDSYVLEKRHIRKDRTLVWVNVTVALSRDNKHGRHAIVIVEDISARKKVEEDLKRTHETSYHQANHDMLTGLANRASFNDRLQEALAYAKRDGHLVALHMMDLDRFKFVNDTFGHHIGDLLLIDVAKRIKSNVRATDLAARLGGDEFVVLQTHLAEPSAAGVLAGKLVEDLRRSYMLDGQNVHGGASVGIAIYPNDAESAAELMKHADLALYEAKNRGRLNYQFYRSQLGIVFRKTQQKEQELVRALQENEFIVHYQPQFDLKNGRIIGMEALLRWRHPTHGVLPASHFIKDAEHARLMLPIGEWVFQTACRQYKDWLDSGLAVPLTVNLSRSQLQDPRLLETILRIVDETGVPASMLQLAVRESTLWEPKIPKDVLKQMKDNGFHLALDEFGAEMTALSTLDKFPFDLVKPGQGLVRSLPDGKREATIMSAIISVSHDMNIAVCAEGVETAEQYEAVKEQGCDSVQGHLLRKPLHAEEMTRLVDRELMH